MFIIVQGGHNEIELKKYMLIKLPILFALK